ncbi:hypothetical protein ACIQ7D_24720 [Streptomyces sp. NPDC096310]|uniref:hypothetical protein n=1 Tax=Streptomyces sp. NPDC096310 TaxID=3366082 RepID=UPI00380769D3
MAVQADEAQVGCGWVVGDAVVAGSGDLDESFRSPVCGEVPCTHIRGVDGDVGGTDAPASLPSCALRLRSASEGPERTGETRPLDALILERSAKAIQTLTGAIADRSADAAVRIACDPDAPESDRCDAVKRLRLTRPVTVVVIASPLQPPSPHSARCAGLLPAPGLREEEKQESVTC